MDSPTTTKALRAVWGGHTILHVLVYFERMNKQVAKSNEAVIYTRLSVARAGDTETLEDQERVCREMAERHGLRVVAVFAEGAGVSAFTKGRRRPQLDALIEHAQANPGTTVVAWELTRLTRRLTDLSRWVEMIEDHGLRILTPQIDTAMGGGMMLLGVFAVFAQEESTQKSDRVRAGKRRQRAAGIWMSSTPPLGYLRGDDGALSVDPEHGPTALEAVRLYLDEQMSLRATALALTDAGMLSRGGKPIGVTSLKTLLASPALAGKIEQDDGTMKTCVGLEGGGLISLDRWQEIQRRINSRSAKIGKPASRTPTTLLSAGVLRCDGCGASMTPQVTSAGKTIYRCAGSLQGKCRRGVTIAASKVEPVVIVEALEVIDRAMGAATGDKFDELERILQSFGSAIEPGAEVETIEREIDEIDGRHDHVVELLAAGTLDASSFAKAVEALKAQRQALADELEMVKSSPLRPLPIDAAEWLTQLADGEIEEAELPGAFTTAAGGLESARAVLSACVGSVRVVRRVAGMSVADRLMFDLN
jgi:DNA invertase Pin-like site-specific DNA recombinase